MIASTDRIRVPESAHYGAGDWAVDGDPGRWPLDTTAGFPADWYTDVTILRGGGRDRNGNPLPVEEIPLERCLVAPRATSDPVDRGDLTNTGAVMYAPGGYEVPLRREP